MADDRDRFNIPVESFLTTILSESDPTLNVAPGSVLHDLLIRPASLILQPQRDHTRLLLRNSRLRNFQVMNEAELDSLASNFLVSRRDGSKASGTQRIFFASPQPVSFGTNVRFLDDSGRAFRPASPVAFTRSDVAANLLTASREYFVDVDVVAEQTGEDYGVAAGTVIRVQGIVGATRTVNPTAFRPGLNRDSNTQLYSRIVGSVANRDLVKRPSIRAGIMDRFSSVREVTVIGFGDSAMHRDVVEATVATQELFPISFCRKANLPLDINGQVSFFEADGTTLIQTPVGGFVGAISDNLDLDFRALSVQLDDSAARTVSVQPGFRVRLLGSGADQQDWNVRLVTLSPMASGEAATTVLILDRPFAELDNSDLQTNPYTIVGAVSTNQFHLGGRIDCYIDSAAVEQKEVIIGTLVTDVNGTAEVPLTPSAVLPSPTYLNSALFENNIGFESPVISIVAVDQLAGLTGVVFRSLVPGQHFLHIKQEQLAKFGQPTNDILLIKGLGAYGLPLFQGSRLRVQYLTNPDISAIQTWVSDPAQRDVGRDIRILGAELLLFDVELVYRGSVSSTDVGSIVSELVAQKSMGAEITVNEIITALSFFGVTDVQMPVTLSARRDNGSGTVEVQSSQDRISAAPSQVFRALPTLSIRKIG